MVCGNRFQQHLGDGGSGWIGCLETAYMLRVRTCGGVIVPYIENATSTISSGGRKHRGNSRNKTDNTGLSGLATDIKKNATVQTTYSLIHVRQTKHKN